MAEKSKILVVGGGFGGVKAALELCREESFDVTLLSDHSHFRYYPALYHAATGGRRAGSSIRLSTILEGSRVKFVRGQAIKLNREQKYIETQQGSKLPFDTLILALGNVTNYFGIKGLKEYSFGIKSAEEAEELKAHLHQQLIDEHRPDLNYVIVGGGPTGIELAGALPSYLRHIMKRHGIAQGKLSISLVEAAPRLLPRSPKDISRAIKRHLQHLGIKLYLGTAVQGETPNLLMAGDTSFESHTVIWTAGVTNHPFFKTNNFSLSEHGKVQVDEHLQAEPNIFVLGDNADTIYSGLAQTALRDGLFVAKNLIRQHQNNSALPYTPKRPIVVLPVGPHWASVEWGKRHFNGLIGWILRSLADLVAFHDLEKWPVASKQWLTTMADDEDNCPTCGR